MTHQQLNSIFTIVVSDTAFQISWKSLISDGPSNFFTRHFIKSNSRIIHVDRNPNTFTLIMKHLRGYPIVARDECEHQDLLNDAYFYDLKRLKQYLKEFIYLNVGGTHFRLRWDIFNKDGHNYFTGPLKHSLLAPHPSPGEALPFTIERDPETFKDMIRHLQGYHIEIRDEHHRQSLLSDAEFYLFRKLRDQLCKSENRQEDEILMFIEDVRPASFQKIGNCIGYENDGRLYESLLVEIDDVNVRWYGGHVFLLEKHIKLPKDPNWSILETITLDPHCAIVMDDKIWNLTEFIEQLSNSNQNWFGIEKSIAKVFPVVLESLSKQRLSLSILKMQVILSRTQANMKREFLNPL
ncbi:uncharacterized protein BX663DRAFT_515796 [Cokeromyces recurvatus]|uniref:uncharacterized protein n=1 Tax=Cokeromyces recurvatus TaxID=90255 RepID=UPI0022211783|nr:uncharacterized protein BX663DRAFT_515796 [Cokeromyces recurvatus]KAI7900941.1 hypothetical protein BX663DRAFT_515796 [Cokeromyces recurvatus]